MVSFKSLLVICTAAIAALAAPTDTDLVVRRSDQESGLAKRTTYTSSSSGTSGSTFYSFYVQSNNGATLTVNTGSYQLSWSSAVQDVVAGIGWNVGSARVINYSGSFSSSGNAYLSVYGWTTSPLVEYYITDSFGSYNPSTGLQLLGTVSSDGGTYDIYKTVRTNAPSIQGTATFNQYWSVRQGKRVGGTVTTANHFNKWKSLGMNMGSFNYQILATEGFQSSGSSNLKVSSG